MTDPARFKMLEAWTRKYGDAPSRVEINTLLVGAPSEILRLTKDIDEAASTVHGFPVIQNSDKGSTLNPESVSFGAENIFQKMEPIYKAAFKKVHGREPTPAELEAVMAVGYQETRFGTAHFPGWGVTYPAELAHHNHGAVQFGRPPAIAGQSFLSEDSTPQGSGGNAKYPITFKIYPDDEAGAADLIKKVGTDPLILMKNNGNSILAFALGMYGNHYYEAFNPSEATRVAHSGDIAAIQTLAKTKPVSVSTNPASVKWWNAGIERATDPVNAGRVFVYGNGLNGTASAVAKGLGRARATKLAMSGISAKPIIGAAAGAGIGFAAGGPAGAAIGAVVGWLGGKKL